MHRFVQMAVLLSLVSMTIVCHGLQASAIRDSSPPGSALQFSDVMDKDWNLVEVRLNQKDIGFDRSQLATDSSRPFFTLRFEADRAGGTAAPNRFGGPYTLGANRAIVFGAIVSTMMAPLFDPVPLSEHTFFVYLQNTYEWNLVDGKLELRSKSADGAEVVLIFAL